MADPTLDDIIQLLEAHDRKMVYITPDRSTCLYLTPGSDDDTIYALSGDFTGTDEEVNNEISRAIQREMAKYN